MSIPTEIINNIAINYINIHDNYLISKQIDIERNNKIKKAINTINKYIYKHILELRIYMDINYYQIPRLMYKKFYPLKDRKKLMLLTLGMVFNDSHSYHRELFNDVLNNPNHLVLNFNKVIDSLELHELTIIGWD